MTDLAKYREEVKQIFPKIEYPNSSEPIQIPTEGDLLKLDTIENLMSNKIKDYQWLNNHHPYLRTLKNNGIHLMCLKENIDTRNPYVMTPNSDKYYPVHMYFIKKKYNAMRDSILSSQQTKRSTTRMTSCSK